MTTANKITLGRIVLIPVFVGLAVQYGSTAKAGAPIEAYRWAAVSVFLLASLSDGIDGYVARRFNQCSRLGTILDPLADKLLLLSAITVLAVAGWPERLPMWFAYLLLTREAVMVTGAFLLQGVLGTVRIQPHWTGKLATVLQMTVLAWVMFQLSPTIGDLFVRIAGVFTFISGVVYFHDGWAQFQASGHGEADTE